MACAAALVARIGRVSRRPSHHASSPPTPSVSTDGDEEPAQRGADAGVDAAHGDDRRQAAALGAGGQAGDRPRLAVAHPADVLPGDERVAVDVGDVHRRRQCGSGAQRAGAVDEHDGDVVDVEHPVEPADERQLGRRRAPAVGHAVGQLRDVLAEVVQRRRPGPRLGDGERAQPGEEQGRGDHPDDRQRQSPGHGRLHPSVIRAGSRRPTPSPGGGRRRASCAAGGRARRPCARRRPSRRPTRRRAAAGG